MIRVGIGGWTYEPWRGVFFPPDLPETGELAYASRQVTSIEINGTFYRTPTPASFRRWADETPDNFVFSLKAPRYTTHRRLLAEAEPSIERFVTSGLTELGTKLGPILWQFPPTKRFDEEDFAAFLALLPATVDGARLRHAVEVRHESFLDQRFVALARRFGVSIVCADSTKYPALFDATGDFMYLRLQNAREEEGTGYSPAELDLWARRLALWAEGGEPGDLPRVAGETRPVAERAVFAYMINGAKVRAPAAAMALIARLRSGEE